MTREDRLKLREAALAAVRAVRARTRDTSGRLPGDWELQTSNSYRRIGAHGDGDVLCAVTQRSDNHPDLHAPPDVLKYIVAAQPAVVLALLDQLDAADAATAQLSSDEERLKRIITSLARGAEQLASATIKDSPAEVLDAFKAFVALLDLNGAPR